VLMVLAVRHALGLAADVRRVLREAAEGEVDRRKIRKVREEGGEERGERVSNYHNMPNIYCDT
jgi:hypothetical protein